MRSRIESLPETSLMGKRLGMSFAANKTQALWQGFMPRVQEVRQRLGKELYSVEVYKDPDFFQHFDPNQEFEKWAAVKVADRDEVSVGMETLTVPAGLYAVFTYRGLASEAPKAYEYIFSIWLPNSAYAIDHRPHLAIMEAHYRPDDPDAEEEIWIPIRKK